MNNYKGLIIKLDNNKEYYILDQITHKSIAYLYAVDIKDKNHVSFFECIYDKINEVKDNELLKELTILFYKNLNI